MKRIVEQMIAEFVGTMLFVFIAAGSVVLAGIAVNQGGDGGSPAVVVIGLLAIALATGLGMAVLISNTGHISGGHHNPAVTISIWVAGKIEAARAAGYIVAQLLGAAAGAGLVALILPTKMWKQTNLGTPAVNLHPFGGAFSFSPGRAVFLEAVLTFILVYTVFATAVDERGSFKVLRGLPIGLAIAVDILVGGFFTGAAMNPARAFGPALVSGTWTNFWVYIVGPITGGILAASLYWFAFLRDRSDDDLEAVAADETGGEEAVLETVLASEAETADDLATLAASEHGDDETAADDAADGPSGDPDGPSGDPEGGGSSPAQA